MCEMVVRGQIEQKRVPAAFEADYISNPNASLCLKCLFERLAAPRRWIDPQACVSLHREKGRWNVAGGLNREQMFPGYWCPVQRPEDAHI